MRFMAFCGCLVVALDCMKSAAGLQPQSLFAASALWLWWGIAGAWLVGGFRILLKGTE